MFVGHKDQLTTTLHSLLELGDVQKRNPGNPGIEEFNKSPRIQEMGVQTEPSKPEPEVVLLLSDDEDEDRPEVIFESLRESRNEPGDESTVEIIMEPREIQKRQDNTEPNWTRFSDWLNKETPTNQNRSFSVEHSTNQNQNEDVKLESTKLYPFNTAFGKNSAIYLLMNGSKLIFSILFVDYISSIQLIN